MDWLNSHIQLLLNGVPPIYLVKKWQKDGRGILTVAKLVGILATKRTCIPLCHPPLQFQIFFDSRIGTISLWL